MTSFRGILFAPLAYGSAEWRHSLSLGGASFSIATQWIFPDTRSRFNSWLLTIPTADQKAMGWLGVRKIRQASWNRLKFCNHRHNGLVAVTQRTHCTMGNLGGNSAMRWSQILGAIESSFDRNAMSLNWDVFEIPLSERDSGSGFEKKYCRKECRVKLPRQKLLIPTTRVRIRSTQHDDKGSHASASVRDWKLSYGPSSRYFPGSVSFHVIVGVANASML